VAASLRGPRARLAGRLAHRAVRLLTAAHSAFLRLPRRPPRAASAGKGLDVLLTGTFHSEDWLRALLAPLAASRACARVRVVSNDPVPRLDDVEWVRPPARAARLLGRTPVRLAVFAREALLRRPHVVGAFHLLLNGLVAVALARLAGARSLYICVGGTAEVDEGGRHGENRLFSLVPGPDPVVERRLLRAVQAADLVVTMGTGARRSFEARGVRTTIRVNGGGIDATLFDPAPTGARPEFDFVFVGRLAPIKRVDLLLAALAIVAEGRPATRAAIVGEGPLRPALEREAGRLGLTDRVCFAGRQERIPGWLRRSRVFVLTSLSEGLPLSAIEAMMCGLPVVAPRVGDLADLVTEGVNGRLVGDRRPESFAAAMAGLVADEALWRAASSEARRSAERYSVPEATARWDGALAALAGDPQRSARGPA
jgi:glycosyltransferase involved in cell wall biosynthesis